MSSVVDSTSAEGMASPVSGRCRIPLDFSSALVEEYLKNLWSQANPFRATFSHCIEEQFTFADLLDNEQYRQDILSYLADSVVVCPAAVMRLATRSRRHERDLLRIALNRMTAPSSTLSLAAVTSIVSDLPHRYLAKIVTRSFFRPLCDKMLGKKGEPWAWLRDPKEVTSFIDAVATVRPSSQIAGKFVPCDVLDNGRAI